MRPLLNDGDMAAVRAISPEKVRAGDIVYYKMSGVAHLHRVWWRWGKNLWIKDDAGIVDLHVIAAGRVTGRLEDDRSRARGWAGLVYSLVVNAAFMTARPFKAALSRPNARSR